MRSEKEPIKKEIIQEKKYPRYIHELTEKVRRYKLDKKALKNCGKKLTPHEKLILKVHLIQAIEELTKNWDPEVEEMELTSEFLTAYEYKFITALPNSDAWTEIVDQYLQNKIKQERAKFLGTSTPSSTLDSSVSAHKHEKKRPRNANKKTSGQSVQTSNLTLLGQRRTQRRRTSSSQPTSDVEVKPE